MAEFPSGNEKSPSCPHCGSSTAEGEAFCRSCGAPLPQKMPVIARSPHRVKSPVRHPKPRTSLSPVRVLALVALILIVAVAAFFAFSSSPLSSRTQNSSNGTESPGVLPEAGGQCSPGLSLCGGRCVDLQTDQDNCGACGFTVPYGETCRKGQFSSSSGTTPAGAALTSATTATPQGSCPAGRSSCNGTCTDTRYDAGNCGSCGISCPSGQNCQNGQCTPPGTPVPPVTTATLVTLVPESCSGRQTLCNNSCTDIFSDKNNCGVCGRACKSQDICVNARCGPACTKSGTSLCDGTCVDLDTDINNCGSCGTGCKTLLPNANGALCSDGKCTLSGCKTDYGDCNKIFSDGCEANLRLDAANCGECGNKCPDGQVCYNKICSVPVGT